MNEHEYLSINGISQSINNSAQELFTDRHIDNSTSSFDNVSLFDQLVITKHHNTNIVRLQVQRHSLNKKVKIMPCKYAVIKDLHTFLGTTHHKTEPKLLPIYSTQSYRLSFAICPKLLLI